MCGIISFKQVNNFRAKAKTSQQYNKNTIYKKGGAMKTKDLNKQLVLNKKTVANLEKVELKNVQGGHNTKPTCPILVSVCQICLETIPC
jgi:hypothetical protein